MTTITRSLIFAAALSGITLATAQTAGAAPQHTSCKELGALVASEARAGTVGEENRSLPPGTIDDLIHTVQVGGDFEGEQVPAFCEPK
jgi:hypothetical protein